MDKKQKVVDLLLRANSQLERERGRKIGISEFSRISKIAFKTLLPLFNPDDSRLPSRNTAKKIAELTGSNEINRIMEYPPLDKGYLRLMRLWPQLNEGQQETLLGWMENLDGESVRVVAT